MTDFVASYVTLDDPLRAYDDVTEAVRQVVARTVPEQFIRPTPCAEWTVLDILNHLVETLDRYGALARGVQPVEGEVITYEDPVGMYAAMAASTRAAFAAPGYLDTVAHTPIGPQPGRVPVQHVVNELIVHGWDLARGTGQPTDIAPGWADASLRSWAAFFAAYPREHIPFNFDPERVAAMDASAADRLAAYLGRAV
jgi:uncharacterized protein (TIGR03086 family)